METPAPASSELPPPESQAAALALFLEGVSLVEIAGALHVDILTVLDFLDAPEARQCIEHYEECIETQARLCAKAARIPAMATLSEVCVSQGSLVERRRAASELLRQSRAAEKADKSRRTNRTEHRTPAPEKFEGNIGIEQTPEPLAHGSFSAHDHTASWHSFEHEDRDSSDAVTDASPVTDSTLAAPHNHHQQTTPPQHAARPTVQPPAKYIRSADDSIRPNEISTPLPDAVPIAA